MFLEHNHILLAVEQVPITQPAIQKLCFPIPQDFTFAGIAISVSVILIRIEVFIRYSKKAISAIKTLDPNAANNSSLKFAENVVNTLDLILPGDTQEIKNPEIAKYLSEHPELVASLIKETNLDTIKKDLTSIVKTP